MSDEEGLGRAAGELSQFDLSPVVERRARRILEASLTIRIWKAEVLCARFEKVKNGKRVETSLAVDVPNRRARLLGVRRMPQEALVMVGEVANLRFNCDRRPIL